MIKAIIFDSDGMTNCAEKFSVRFSRDFDIPYDRILPFFLNEFKGCLIGKSDLKEVIKPYLEKWGWRGTVDDLLDYWFAGEVNVDTRVMDAIGKLKQRGIKCYLATNQEKYRTDFMIEQMNYKTIFDGIFSSAEIGRKKPQTEFFQAVLEKIGNPPKDEVMFWDDDQENVDGAKDFGFQSCLYANFDEFKKTISHLLINSLP